MWFVFVLCIIIGIMDGLKRMSDARIGVGAAKPSKNLFTFLFTDRY